MNIAKILKDCPEGTELYSPIYGKVVFDCINGKYIDVFWYSNNSPVHSSFCSNGHYYNKKDSECLLFPSKDNRDWSTFNVPKKEYTFKPFDKVLVRDYDEDTWFCDLFSHISDNKNSPYATTGNILWRQCIPYKGNEHLVGTTDNHK